MNYTKRALVLGAGGFIGSHMVKRLREEGYWVRGADLKDPEFEKSAANEFITCDLRDYSWVNRLIKFAGYQGNFYHQIVDKFLEPFDEIYQFAADMGGAGYIFTGEHFFGTNVHRTHEVTIHQSSSRFNAFVNEQEGTSL